MDTLHLCGSFAWLAVAHFVADFLLQSHEMALNKSKHIKVLMTHVSIHFFVFLGVALVLFSPYNSDFGVTVLRAGMLSLINASLHAVIDWNIWRGYRRYAERQPSSTYKFYEDHWFFVTIGLDQLLHGLSITLALFLSMP